MKVSLLKSLLFPLAVGAFAVNAHAETRLAFGATNAQSATMLTLRLSRRWLNKTMTTTRYR